MALTTRQEELLHRAVLAWIADQERQNTPYWGARLVTATTAQKRAALVPYVQALKAGVETTITTLTTTRAAQDADLTTSLADADQVLTELGA